ncbi:MAG: outer membrane beta-barrel protein [Cytophagaceae bacterium]
MKKALLLSFVLMLSVSAFSQVNVGLRFAPGFGLNRVDHDDVPGNSFSSAGTGLRFMFGPEAYYAINDNASFVTGLNYNVRRVGLQYTVSNPETGIGSSFRDVYSLQYLSIPLYVHLLTNEVQTDTRIYFNVGGGFDWRINSRVNKSNNEAPYVEKFRMYDADMMLGTGIQYKVGENSFILAGISYNRGLLNTISRVRPGFSNPDVRVRTDLASLDMRYKF